MRLPRFLPLIFLAFAACTPADKTVVTDHLMGNAQQVAAIKEVAFRFLMRNIQLETREKFVDFGDQSAMDPPPGFLQRFSDLKVTLKPVSQAAFPEPDAKDPADARRFLGVKDRASGKDAIVYAARIEKWTDTTHVNVLASVFTGPLRDGGEVELHIAVNNGKWSIESTGDFSTN